MQNTEFINLLNEKNISQNLLNFLDNKDKYFLITTNKKLYMNFKDNIKKQSNLNLKQNSKKNPNNKKKSNPKNIQYLIKQEECTILKTTIFKCPKNIFQTCDNWQHTNQIIYKTQTIGKKMKSGMYAFFVDKMDRKNIFYMNRSLIDKSLDYLTGGFQNDNIDQQQQYKQLYTGQQLTNNFDFTSQQSLRERQKQILEGLNMKKTKKQQQLKFKFQFGVQNIKTLKRFSIILCAGGYFSMGIFQKNKCILHKSDHKYVCRKAAGGRQLNRDKNSGSNIKSMGSQIRRNQQKIHQQKVSNILSENLNELQKSDIIFFQAPGFNRLMLINQNEALYKLRDKLRSVCLTAKKANFTQVQKIYEAITKIYIVKGREQQK